MPDGPKPVPWDLDRRAAGQAQPDTGPLSISAAACGHCGARDQSVCRNVGRKDLLRLFPCGVRTQDRPAGTTLFHQGEPFDFVLILRSGWVVTYKVFEDGQRQIIRFALPGDLIGFEGDAVSGMAYGAEAITNVTVCGVKRSRFLRVCAESPQLAMNFANTLARETLSAWNHVAALGQQGALGRVANLLLDLHRRVVSRGGANGAAVHLPISQIHIGDATGLTSVHVCRTLKQMRQDGLLEFRKERLVLLDPRRLAEVAQLDPEVALDCPSPRLAIV